MRCFLVSVLFVVWFLPAYGQELFPMMEPASNTPPKGVLGVRLFDESYNEVDRMRNLIALRVSYGLLPRLTVAVTPSVSNHHNATLPVEFPDHNTPNIGVNHPYLLNGVDCYAKFRFVSRDGEHTHFRVSAYGEYSFLNTAHDEAEPTLLDDTRGFGGGMIATYLVQHFAASFTGGVIIPTQYDGVIPDIIPSFPSLPAKIDYGNACNYDLSLGYLLFPATYVSYKQVNWNIYMEFLGKSYEGAQVQVANLSTPITYYTLAHFTNYALRPGHYVEAYPGLQCIVRSNTRIDLSVGYPVLNKSFVHFYPVYNIGVQRYLFLNQARKQPSHPH